MNAPVTIAHIELAWAAHPHERRSSFSPVVERTAQALANLEARHSGLIRTLEAERDEARAGYDALDKNWSLVHETAMEALRAALSMPEATIPEMVRRIQKDLADPLPEKHVFWDEDSIYVVAASCEDASLVYAQHLGDDPQFDTLAFSRFPDEKEISIRVWLSGRSAMQIAPVDEAESAAIGVCKQSARAWAEQQPRGFLCTTDS